MLAKNATLRPGSNLQIRCFHCGILVDIRSEANKIMLKIIKEHEELTDDEDNGIIFLHT